MNLASSLPLVILIVVVVGLRARRTMTSQLVRPVMLIGRLVVLTLLSIVILLSMVPQTMMFLGIIIGLGIGFGLAFFGLRHTQFEKASGGLRYRANPYIGGIVLLLVGQKLHCFHEQTWHCPWANRTNPWMQSISLASVSLWPWMMWTPRMGS